jgi:DNA repair exonuclease SbcCD ATPase subunit
MKIASIALHDFGPYEEAEVQFDQPLSIIGGDNAQGKTTLANALRFTLTPRCPNTDKRGGGANDNIRLGAKKAEIIAAIDTAKGAVQIFTTYGPGTKVRNQSIKNGSSAVAAGFGLFLDRQSEALSCCLDTSYFFNPKTDQKDILAALILPTSHEFDPAMVEMATSRLGKFDWSKSPVAVIDQVYDTAYRARREAKAALGAIYIPPTPDKPAHDAQKVQHKLTKLRAEAAKETKKLKGGGSTAVGRVEQELEQEREGLTKALDDRTESIQQRNEIDKDIISGADFTALEKRAAGRKLFDSIQSQIDTLDQEGEAQRAARAIFAELLQDEQGNPVDEACCPTCTQSITRQFIDGKIAEHKKLEESANAAAATLLTEQKALGDIAGAEREIAENRARVDRKLDLVKSVVRATDTIAGIEKAIAGLEKELTTAQQEVSEPADTSALDALNKEIEEWEALLSPALNYDATLSQIDRLSKQQDEFQAVVNDLETLCSTFGKDGIKAELIAKHVQAFTGTINDVLAAWGYSAKLSQDADEFFVQSPKTAPEFLPVKQLSGFEQLAFGVALQCAIAVYSKIKLVVVDEAQTMVDSQRNRLFGSVKAMIDDGQLDQAFVILADNRTEAPHKAGVAYYRVAAGKVDRL